VSGADCTQPFCGWTGAVADCDTSPFGPRCPDCGGEVTIFDAPSLTGVSEFAVISCRECGSSGGEHRYGCLQIDPADIRLADPTVPGDV